MRIQSDLLLLHRRHLFGILRLRLLVLLIWVVLLWIGMRRSALLIHFLRRRRLVALIVGLVRRRLLGRLVRRLGWLVVWLLRRLLIVATHHALRAEESH